MIECALFGAGRIGKIHAGNVAREAGARIKYVIDPNIEAASALAAEHGATPATTEQVFADKAIGAVLICSYTDTHADLILAAAAAGKQIFCEKPIDLAIAPRANVRRSRRARRRHVHDRLPAPLRPHVLRGEDEARRGRDRHPEMLIVTSRDPGAPPIAYIEELRRHLQGHADPRLRHLSLDPRRRSGDVHANASCLIDSAIGDAGDVDSHRRDDPHEDGPALPDQHEPPRGLRLRPALRGAGERRHAAGRQSRAHRSDRVHETAVTRDLPLHFFLERYRAAYANEMAHFFAALAGKEKVRTTIDDGLKALELAEAATTSWREDRIVKM